MEHKLPRLSDRIAIGTLSASPFCIGIVDDPDAIGVAYDAGINFFFLSADMHWPRYEATRIGIERLLARVPRDQIVIAAAAYVTQREFCSEPFREVLAAVPDLRTLDVLVAGGAYGSEFATRWEVYLEHRRQGFVGAQAIGASFHDRAAAATAIAGGTLDVAFVRYNPAHPGAQRDLFPHLPLDRRTRVLGFTSTGAHKPAPAVPDDVWIPDVTDHYRFALSRPELDGLLCSPTLPAHVAELAAAIAEGPLSIEEQEHMIELALAH